MSAWKSPLLYLGMLIILIAGVALAAPVFIDWESYRERFEAYGRDLTGREVEIAGDIEARLFPWPALRLENVKVSNPPGSAMQHLFTAGEIEFKMQLAPLLSGHVEVEAINVDRPVFGFERLASEDWSWPIGANSSIGKLVDPDRVAVAAITLTNGSVTLADRKRSGSARLENLEAMLSAPALSGPWKLRGGATYRGEEIDIAFSTGKLQAGEATRITLGIDPRSGDGLSYNFDGKIGGDREKPVSGQLKVAPARPPAAAEAEGAESRWPDFALRTEIAAGFDIVELKKIEIAPSRSAEPGKFITGEASIRLGGDIDVATRLEAARLDLDAMIEDRQALLASEAWIGGLADFLNRLPEGLTVKLGLDVTSLIVGGETLDASRLAVEASSGRLRVEEVSVALPGQSRVSFAGLFSSEATEPLVSGTISLDAVSARDLALWALPGHARSIGEVWSGARGRLKLAAKIDAAPDALRLSAVEATLDDARLSGGFTYRGGSDPALAVRLVTDTLNLDRYAPEGLLTASARDRKLDAGIDLVASSMRFGNFQLTLQADRVALHGVEAEDIAIDIGADEEGVELRTVEIGNVGGAKLDVTGLIRFPGEGVSGSLNALVDAADPRGMLRLFGLLEGDPRHEPKWASALGPLNVKLVAEATTLNHYTQASASLIGKAGEAELSLGGRFDGEIAAWQDGHIAVEGEAKSTASDLIAAVTGLALPSEAKRPSSFEASGTGSLRRGVATTLEAALFGGKLQFAGTVAMADKPAVSGRVALLAERAGELLAALKLPAGELSPLAGVLSAESELEFDGNAITMKSLSGTAGGSSYSGDLRLALAPLPALTGTLSTGRLSLPWLLQTILVLPEEGADLASRFRPRLPALASVNIALTAGRLDALGALSIENAKLAVHLDSEAFRVEGKGIGPSQSPGEFKLLAKLDEDGATVEGSAKATVDLQRLFRTEDGEPVIVGAGAFKVDFSGSGRTPRGVLAAARGEGEYELPTGMLKRVDPSAFGRDLAAVRRPAEIDELIRGSLRSGDLAFTGGKGKLTLGQGALAAEPLGIAGKGMTGEIRLTVEVASAEADIGLMLSLLEPQGLPPFELAYAGPPSALQASSNTQELKSRLSVKVLQEGIDQLEELQRQERQLMQEEDQFRREQEERREGEREALRKLRALEARRKIELERPPVGEAAPEPSDPRILPERGANGQTDPGPMPVQGAQQSQAKAEVPRPRKKPPPARVELDSRGPTVLPQSLVPVPSRESWSLFPTTPGPASNFPARASGRDR